MRILVTGAAGFIGSVLTDALIQRGDTVVGIDNFNNFYDPAIKHANVQEVLDSGAPGRFEMHELDFVTEVDRLRDLFKAARPDAIVHLAAWAGVRPSIQRPMLYQKTNIEGTMNLLELAREFDRVPFVYASSSSVYGARTEVPFRETDRVDDPISPYAATKKACELIGYTYHHLHKIPFYGLRFFTVYGPRQRPEMAIHMFARHIIEERPIRMFGDGSSSRDYTYVTDTAAGVVSVVDRAVKSEEYRIYNFGCSATTTLKSLIEQIEDAVGKKAIIEQVGDQPGDVPTTYADISRAKSELGYDPQTPVSEGIPKFVTWLKARRKAAGL